MRAKTYYSVGEVLLEQLRSNELGHFNCRGDYVLPNKGKITAERLGFKPSY